MIAYSKIHCELTNLCNAACPSCPRNIGGADIHQSDDWVDNYVTLEQFKLWWKDGSNDNVRHFWVNGNYGDLIMNPESLEIIDYVSSWKNIEYIHINTNGSARNQTWWQNLTQILKRVDKHLVDFAIDGLEDTHHLYRQNTSWQRIIDNAKTVIAAGGHARWTMTQFKENMHQVDTCRELAYSLGFKEFATRVSTRHIDGKHTAVFNNKFENIHNLHHVSVNDQVPLLSLEDSVKSIQKRKKDYDISNKLLEKSKEYRLNFIRNRYEEKFKKSYKLGTVGEVDCMYPLQGSLYIDSFGNVWPCCFMGHAIHSGSRYAKQMLMTYVSETGKSVDDQSLSNRSLTEILADSTSLVNYVTGIIKGPFEIDKAYICYDFCGKTSSNWVDLNPHTFVNLN